MQSLKIWVIRNPVAGKNSRRLVAKMLDMLTKKVQLIIRDTCYAGHAQQLTSEACREGADLLIAAGGDGTINEIVNSLILYKQEHHTCPVLAIFPSGTVNLVANELEISRNPQTFVDLILANKRCDIWPAKVNDQYFIANVGVGFDGYIVSKVTQHFKKKFSKLAYVYQSLRLIRKDWRQYYEVTVDEACYTACAAIVVNSRYYAGPYSITPQVRLTKPQLYVCLFESGIRWDIFSYFWWLLRDDLHKHPHVKILSSNNIHITGTAQYVQIDGDPTGSLPLTITPGDTPLTVLTK